MELRNYQKESINNFWDSEEKNILLCLQTGAGKTVIFTEIAKQFFDLETKKVLILTHRVELLKQAKNKLGERVFLIEAGLKVIPNDYDFYIGMVETVKRRLNILPSFGLVIIDECHFGNFKKLPFFDMENVKVLGVTATPISNPPLATFYNKMIEPTNISELIENNYLLNCDVYGFGSNEVSKQKFKTKGGDFEEQQLEAFYSSEKMVKNVVEAYWQIIKGKKTLIFNVNVAHNDLVHEALVQEGLNAYKIDGQRPKKERVEILERFKNESDAILCNVGVLTTGFDEPSIEFIVLNRATKSLPLYLQMIGRGSRLHESMDKFIVIDLGLNTARHGTYDDYRDWENYFKKGLEKGKGGGTAPVKECKECGKIHHIKIKICDNCGFSFEKEMAEQKEDERVYSLKLLIKSDRVNPRTERLCKTAEERKYKPYQALHKICEKMIYNQEKYINILTDKDCEDIVLKELSIWCKYYKKQNNKFHKELILKILNEKRKPNPSTDISMVQQ